MVSSCSRQVKKHFHSTQLVVDRFKLKATGDCSRAFSVSSLTPGIEINACSIHQYLEVSFKCDALLYSLRRLIVSLSKGRGIKRKNGLEKFFFETLRNLIAVISDYCSY